jgi:hypothetical protein
MDPNEINKEDLMLPQRNYEPDKPAAPIRTFSTDLAQAVRKDEMSVIKVAMAEEKRRHEEEAATSAATPQNKMFIVVGTIFILLAIGAVAAVMIIKNNRAPSITDSEIKLPTIISAEASTSLEVSNLPEGKIIELSKTAVQNVSGADGQVVNIYFTDSTSGTKQVISSAAFLLGIKSEIPGALLRSLNNAFMLGIFSKDSSHHPFIILRTNDYGIAFANMFEWEKELFSDFYLPLNLSGDEENFTNKFTDLLVENKDTRVLKKDDGTISLMYGFADEKTIIISDGIETFKEVLRRLQSTR